jgi:hypothetical protein
MAAQDVNREPRTREGWGLAERLGQDGDSPGRGVGGGVGGLRAESPGWWVGAAAGGEQPEAGRARTLDELAPAHGGHNGWHPWWLGGPTPLAADLGRWRLSAGRLAAAAER